MMVLVPRTMDVHTTRQGVILYPVRGDKIGRQASGLGRHTWTLVGTSNPIWITQAKDGDIRLRWTFLVPASDDAARSAAVIFQTWRRLTSL